MGNFMSFPTPREHVLTCGNTSVGVIPDICLITHFQVGSWQILYRPMQTGNILIRTGAGQTDHPFGGAPVTSKYSVPFDSLPCAMGAGLRPFGTATLSISL